VDAYVRDVNRATEAQRVRTAWMSSFGCCRSSSSHDSMRQKISPEMSRRHFFGCRNLSTRLSRFAYTQRNRLSFASRSGRSPLNSVVEGAEHSNYDWREGPLWVYSVEKLADGAFSIISGGHQTINLATCVAYARFWRVGFLIHPLTRQRNRVFQQNRSNADIECFRSPRNAGSLAAAPSLVATRLGLSCSWGVREALVAGHNAPDRLAAARAGSIFWFMRNRLSGSYLRFTWARRS